MKGNHGWGWFLVVLLPASAQPVFHLDSAKRPGFEVSGWLKLGVRARLQLDSAPLGAAGALAEPAFGIHRARLGLDGKLFRKLEFQVEREFEDGERGWRDVWLEYEFSKRLALRGGRTKIPFGLDQLTSVAELDFINRSLIGATLSPGRDTGLEARGALVKRWLRYEAGAFLGGGDNGGVDASTGAARLTSRVLKSASLGSLEIGGATAWGMTPTGYFSLKGKTVAGETYFSRLFVNGLRRRAGAEAEWTCRRVRARFEFIQVSEQRRRQSFLGADLAPLDSSGWYISGVYGLTKLPRKTRESFYWPGQIELAARYETLGFGGGKPGGIPSTSPRAVTIAPNRDSVVTLGVNWRPQQHIRLQANVLRESLLESLRTGRAIFQGIWLVQFRLQFVL